MRPAPSAPRLLPMQTDGGPRRSALPATNATPETDFSPALRDAGAISDRIARDEAAADQARERYRTAGLPDLPPDAALGREVAPNERLHATHAMAILEVGPPESVEEARGISGGTLFVTSRRLVHRGTAIRDWPLEAIAEMNVALERLLLIGLRDGTDLAIEVDQPRLLRVQLAAAIAARRAAACELLES